VINGDVAPLLSQLSQQEVRGTLFRVKQETPSRSVLHRASEE